MPLEQATIKLLQTGEFVLFLKCPTKQSCHSEKQKKNFLRPDASELTQTLVSDDEPCLHCTFYITVANDASFPVTQGYHHLCPGNSFSLGSVWLFRVHNHIDCFSHFLSIASITRDALLAFLDEVGVCISERSNYLGVGYLRTFYIYKRFKLSKAFWGCK